MIFLEKKTPNDVLEKPSNILEQFFKNKVVFFNLFLCFRQTWTMLGAPFIEHLIYICLQFIYNWLTGYVKIKT